MQQRPELWDRLPKESEEAYAAFLAFLQQAPPRKHLRLVGPWPMGELYKWFNAHRWAARAAAWDQRVQKVHEEEFLAQVARHGRESARRYLEIEEDGIHLLELKIRKALRDELAVPTTTPGKLLEIVTSLEKIQRIARLARGESTDIISERVDLSHLSPEDLERLDAILSSTPGAKNGP